MPAFAVISPTSADAELFDVFFVAVRFHTDDRDPHGAGIAAGTAFGTGRAVLFQPEKGHSVKQSHSQTERADIAEIQPPQSPYRETAEQLAEQ